MSNDDSKKNDINDYFYSADVRFLVAMGPATPPASSSHIGGNFHPTWKNNSMLWKNNFHHVVKKERHGNITTITDIQAMQYLQADSSFTKWCPFKKTIFQLFHVNSDAAPIVRQHQHDVETRKPWSWCWVSSKSSLKQENNNCP